MQQTIPVFIIEDNRLLRDGIVSLLGGCPDIRVVDSVGSPGVALRKIREVRPQVVLVDASLRGRDSQRLVRDVRKAAPEARVIVMDLLPAQEDIAEFIQAGASGLILKNATADEMAKTIRMVAAGTEVLPSILAQTLVSQIAKCAAGRATPEAMSAVRLSKREREIANLIAHGLSNKEIADQLFISTSTVKSHVHNLLDKLVLRNRIELAVFMHTDQ